MQNSTPISKVVSLLLGAGLAALLGYAGYQLLRAWQFSNAVEQLSSADAETRSKAIRFMRDRGPEQALVPLVSALSAENPEVRAEMAQELSAIAPPFHLWSEGAFDKVKLDPASRSGWHRKYRWWPAFWAGDPARLEIALPILLNATRDGDEQVSNSATSFIRKIGPPAIPYLQEQFIDDESMRKAIADCLLGSGIDALPAFENILAGDLDASAKSLALRKAGTLQHDAAFAFIARYTEHPEVVVRKAALDAVRKWTRRSAFITDTETIMKSSTDKLSEAQAVAMAKSGAAERAAIAAHNERYGPKVADLLTRVLLEDDDPAVRKYAARKIKDILSRRSSPIFAWDSLPGIPDHVIIGLIEALFDSVERDGIEQVNFSPAPPYNPSPLSRYIPLVSEQLTRKLRESDQADVRWAAAHALTVPPAYEQEIHDERSKQVRTKVIDLRKEIEKPLVDQILMALSQALADEDSARVRDQINKAIASYKKPTTARSGGFE